MKEQLTTSQLEKAQRQEGHIKNQIEAIRRLREDRVKLETVVNTEKQQFCHLEIELKTTQSLVDHLKATVDSFEKRLAQGTQRNVVYDGKVKATEMN